jgi:hypothetical protein
VPNSRGLEAELEGVPEVKIVEEFFLYNSSFEHFKLY